MPIPSATRDHVQQRLHDVSPQPDARSRSESAAPVEAREEDAVVRQNLLARFIGSRAGFHRVRRRTRTEVNLMRPVAVAVLFMLVTIGCGGSHQPSAPESGPPLPVFDFSAIGGSWVGTGTENNGITFWIEARLDVGAEQGGKVGDIEYGPANSALGDGSETFCIGRWFAASANPPEYRVDERISPCPDGTITLEHNFSSNTLDYHYVPHDGNTSIAATATLTRR